LKRISVIVLPLVFSACSLIYDDLSVCGEPLVINYQLQLRTELSTQLQTEFSADTDSAVHEALKGWLAPVFTDKAKDIDLHFFSQETDLISRRIQDVLNANSTSYTINLPKMNYMHLALANIADNDQMYLADNTHSATMRLNLQDKKVLSPLNTGVLTARLPMAVDDSAQQFSVYLYMVNAAVALVIDTTACDSLVSMSGTMNDGACGFSVRDSVYSYERLCSFTLENIPVADAHTSKHAMPARRTEETEEAPVCLATVGMPTRDDMPWTMTVVSSMQDNRQAVNTITVDEPLKAGTLRIIRLKTEPDGKLVEVGQEVGISITVDWKDGSEHEIEI